MRDLHSAFEVNGKVVNSKVQDQSIIHRLNLNLGNKTLGDLGLKLAANHMLHICEYDLHIPLTQIPRHSSQRKL